MNGVCVSLVKETQYHFSSVCNKLRIMNSKQEAINANKNSTSLQTPVVLYVYIGIPSGIQYLTRDNKL